MTFSFTHVPLSPHLPQPSSIPSLPALPLSLLPTPPVSSPSPAPTPQSSQNETLPKVQPSLPSWGTSLKFQNAAQPPPHLVGLQGVSVPVRRRCLPWLQGRDAEEVGVRPSAPPRSGYNTACHLIFTGRTSASDRELWAHCWSSSAGHRCFQDEASTG